jgi:protein phosphatase
LTEAGDGAKAKDVRRALEICVDNANLSIYNSANSNAHYAGMGTTLVVTVFKDDKLMVGHIGDSRCYRARKGEFEQITKDHSLLQEQIDAGLITKEQAVNSSIKNLVTRALGVEEVVLLEINEYAVEIGDTYLLCSDGLSDMADHASIARIVLSEADLGQKTDSLIQLANQQGGRDNISVVLVEVREDAERRGLIARLLGK